MISRIYQHEYDHMLVEHLQNMLVNETRYVYKNAKMMNKYSKKKMKPYEFPKLVIEEQRFI